ncbi:sac3 ganp family protein, partial [Cyclospora cayetanensis]
MVIARLASIPMLRPALTECIGSPPATLLVRLPARALRLSRARTAPRPMRTSSLHSSRCGLVSPFLARALCGCASEDLFLLFLKAYGIGTSVTPRGLPVCLLEQTDKSLLQDLSSYKKAKGPRAPSAFLAPPLMLLEKAAPGSGLPPRAA